MEENAEVNGQEGASATLVNGKPSEVWQAERRKLEAEARKAEAEAEAALAKAELDRAEAVHTAAETRSAVAEAAVDEMHQRAKEMELEALEYKRTCEYSKDEYHHIFMFKDAVSSGSVERCMNQLRTWARMDEKKDAKSALEIWFFSPGGEVISGMALFDYIQQLRNAGHYIITGCMGYAASMAGILLQAGDKRVMGRESYVLIHEIAAGTSGKIGEIEDTVEFLKKIENRVLDIFAERSKASGCQKPLTKKQIANHWHRKDWWLTSEECLTHGFVDELR